MLRTAVSKAVAREKSDASKLPTLAQLLLPKNQRSFSKDVESWLAEHDLAAHLESLAAHVLRALPTDEVDEMDKWVDVRKTSRSTMAPLAAGDVINQDSACIEAAGSIEVVRGEWMGKRVHVRKVHRQPSREASQDVMRVCAHRHACISSTAPFLQTLRHEHILPTFGYFVETRSVSTVHPQVGSALRTLLRQRTSHLTSMQVLSVAEAVASAVAHMHTLGFLHRNLSCAVVFTSEDTASSDSSLCALSGAVVGGFDFVVRTARGRMSSSAWLPEVHAPETPHTRIFDWASDMYGVGALLLEMCCYGDLSAAESIAARFAAENAVPSNIPDELWRRIVAPCLAHSPDARPSAHTLQESAKAMISEQRRDGERHMQYVAFRSDTIDAMTLSSLRQAGAPAGACQDDFVECSNLDAQGWRQVADVLKTNCRLTHLRLSDSSVNIDRLCVHGDTTLRALELVRCRDVTSSALLAALAPMLRVLVLNDTHLGDVDAAVVVHGALRDVHGLVELGMNSVGGAERFAHALMAECDEGRTATLQRLGIGGNAIPPSVLGRLCAVWFQRGTELTELDLSGSVLDYYTLGNVAQVVRQSSSLRTLKLQSMELSAPALWLLLSANRSRPVELGTVAVHIDDSIDHQHATALRAVSRP